MRTLSFPPGISAGISARYFHNRKLEATRPGRRLLIIQHRPAVRRPSMCALPVPRAVANRFPPTRTNLRARLERVLLLYADAKDGGGTAPHGCVICRHRLLQQRLPARFSLEDHTEAHRPRHTPQADLATSGGTTPTRPSSSVDLLSGGSRCACASPSYPQQHPLVLRHRLTGPRATSAGG